jgi:hypothetical protein
MKKNISLFSLKTIFYLFIIFSIIFGFSTIVKKTNRLLSHPEEIRNVRLHAPWFHPTDNVVILFDKDKLEKNPDIHQNIKENLLLYDIIGRTLFLILLVGILFLLKNLILSIKNKTFFESRNIKLIKILSIVVAVWVIGKIIMYELIPLFVPVDLIQESINFTPIHESFFWSILSSIDFKMLFASIVLYITSVLFREGYSLKEEADLTI